MSVLSSLPLLVLLSASPGPAPSEVEWALAEAGRWLPSVGVGHCSKSLLDSKKAEIVPPAAPLFVELAPLLRAADKRLARPLKNDGEAPAGTPEGRLGLLDLDQDGKREAVFVGRGCSPSPYYAVFRNEGGWRLAQEGRSRLIAVEVRQGALHLWGAFDGYGVMGPYLEVARAGGGVLSFQLPETSDFPAPFAVKPCTARESASLRQAPIVDDTPQDSGFGDGGDNLVRGNLVQALAKDASGWSLGTRTVGGVAWSFCAFALPKDAESRLPKVLNQPVRTSREGLGFGRTIVLGWIRSAELH